MFGGIFLLIIQIKKDSFFMDIKKLKKLSSLSKGYRFYEGDRNLKENQMLKKGIHFIHYRCILKGGLNRTIVLISYTREKFQLLNQINLNQLTREAV
jgi:hypothetical protein